ncbi:MAG: AlpA family phage regulatory protein [Comamonas sp.]
MHPNNAIRTAHTLTATQLQSNYQDRLLRIDAVRFLTSLSRSTIYSRIAAGEFPHAVRVHGNCMAWRESEIHAWIASRPCALLPAAKEMK